MKTHNMYAVHTYLSFFILLLLVSESMAQSRSGQVRLGWTPPVDENNEPFHDFDFYRLYTCNQEIKKIGEKVECPGGTLSTKTVEKKKSETVIFHSVPTEDTIFVRVVTATTAGNESELSNQFMINPSDWDVLASLAIRDHLMGASEADANQVIDRLSDGCTDLNPECTWSTDEAESVWLEFDFKNLYKLYNVRLYGDTDSQRVSHSWSLRYKMEADAQWKPAFESESALVADWVQQDLGAISARFVRVEIFGKPGTNGVQARELEIYGRKDLAEDMTSPSSPSPSTMQGVTLPGTVQVENYSSGGEGVGYHDTTKGNVGNEYRTDDVDIRRLTDDNYAISWTDNGEWLAYQVEVPQSASFSIGLYYAAAHGPDQVIVSLSVDDFIVIKRLPLPGTGSETKFVPVPLVTVALPAGKHKIKLVVDQGLVDFDKIVFNKILQ
jgi:hypothetical protein